MQIPSQWILIDGLASFSSPIRFSRSNRPFYSEHEDLIRLRIDPFPSSPSTSLSSLFFEQISQLTIPVNDQSSSELVISFGSFYLLNYSERVTPPERLDSLINDHCLPPLFETFVPSTILECIEITEHNLDCFQQVFYRSNQQLKEEVKLTFENAATSSFVSSQYVESSDGLLALVFPWFQMNFIEHRREIIVICLDLDTRTELRLHFDKNGRFQFVESSPRLHWKCFQQQKDARRPDLLYEYRSWTSISGSTPSWLFQDETLLDPTRPLTLPLQANIVPVLSYSRVTNVFAYAHFQVHLIRTPAPVHFQNDDFYPVRCTLGTFDQEHSVEIHRPLNERRGLSQETLRTLMSLAEDLGQMLDSI